MSTHTERVYGEKYARKTYQKDLIEELFDDSTCSPLDLVVAAMVMAKGVCDKDESKKCSEDIAEVLELVLKAMSARKTTPQGDSYVDIKDCITAYESCVTLFSNLRAQIQTDGESNFLYNYFNDAGQKQLVVEIVEFLIKFFKLFVNFLSKKLNSIKGKTLRYADELELYRENISPESVGKVLGKVKLTLALRSRFGDDYDSFTEYCRKLFVGRVLVTVAFHDSPIQHTTMDFMKNCKKFVDSEPIHVKLSPSTPTVEQTQTYPIPSGVANVSQSPAKPVFTSQAEEMTNKSQYKSRETKDKAGKFNQNPRKHRVGVFDDIL